MICYFVKGTVRSRNCDRNSQITDLVLDQAYNGYTVHPPSSLKALADAGQLWVRLGIGSACRDVKVEVFYSTYHSQWIARTAADTVTCNNLLSLPIYGATTRVGTTTNYAVCPVSF